MRCKSPKGLLLKLWVAIVAMTTVCCGVEYEDIPELEYEFEEYINNDNFNDWKVGIFVDSPEYLSPVLGFPVYRGTMIVTEEGVELIDGLKTIPGGEKPRNTEERTEELREAWNVLESCELALDYTEAYLKHIDHRFADETFHVDQYVIAFHCWNSRGTSEDVEFSDGVVFIYEKETKEIEYAARIKLTKNYKYKYHSFFWAVDVEEIE